MAQPSIAEPSRQRRAEHTERFVAFAFAAADLVFEVASTSEITYAAGAFRARLGEEPEAFIGRPMQSLVHPADHPSLDIAFTLLRERGRLSPLIVRLAAPDRPRFALGGLALGPERFCFTLAQPPAQLESETTLSRDAFQRVSAARARDRSACEVGFIELANPESISSAAVQQALHAVAPDSVSSELAPGRFGVLGSAGSGQLPSVLKMLEESLRATSGATVVTHQLALQPDGLTSTQAARALGQALIVFARAGQDGLSKAGFSGGLAGYVDQAAMHSAALRRVIKERRFELHFQPIVCFERRKLHHYEALVRPQPIKGCDSILPQEFVLLLETLGLVVDFDLAVAETVAAAAARSPAPIAFNSSGQSVQDPNFRDRLLPILSTSPGYRGGRLLLEMTETADVEDLAEAKRTVEALRSMDVPFCLDDFGAGTADVRVLRALPADHVKLDGSFVPGVAAGGRERGLVAGIVEIARAAGATVVAEQVETEEEAIAMAAVGATYGQGWLFGRAAPLPPASVAAGRRSGERESWG